jgi:hypothetical protein
MLIRISDWDYNWQEQYELKEPLRLPKGTVLRIRATFDNSAENPNNPSSPPRIVRLGEQTTNEMCFVFIGISTTSNNPLPLAPVGNVFPRLKTVDELRKRNTPIENTWIGALR